MEDESDRAPNVPDGLLTLEIAENWLAWLEEIATAERDLGAAVRIVLLNLFKHLDARGAIDGHRFVQSLRAETQQLPKPNERIALQCLLDDFARVLPPPNTGEPEPGPRH